MRASCWAVMSLLLAGKGISFLHAFPTMMGRSGSRCVNGLRSVALTKRRDFIHTSSPVTSKCTNLCYPSTVQLGLAGGEAIWRPNAPRMPTALSAETPPRRGSSSLGSGSSDSRKNASNSKTGSNKPRLAPGRRIGDPVPGPGTSGTGGVRSAGPAGRPAGPRPGRGVGAASAAAQAGGRGRGSQSPYGAGRGGRGAIRAMHDGGPRKLDRLGEIPEDKLDVSFTRSSGAGGQNVNKLSTKVEIRFVVSEADWLPHDVRLRLARRESGRINSKGELVVTSQEFRTQMRNRSQALLKLRGMINDAWEPEKERKMRTGVSKAGKEMRLKEKHRRSDVKSGRSKLSSRDYD